MDKTAAKIRSSVWNRLMLYDRIIHAFQENPDDFLYQYSLHVNGKERRIITYKDNKNGVALRHMHTLIDLFMKNLYASSNASYAYKEGTSIHACLDRHMSSDVFLKADIHAYFDSVNKEILKQKIMDFPNLKTKQRRLSSLLDCCFYENRMPIGLITSPVLSDIYLNEIDRYFEKDAALIYTRYADDFIISVTGEDAEIRLSAVREKLSSMLSGLGLEINDRKTYIRRLKQPGDAIHLLGLNLVYCEAGKNRITVSDSYVRRTSKEFCEYLNRKGKLTEAERKKAFLSVYGRIQFIVGASESSAKKLNKMLSVKLGQEISLDYGSLSLL